MVPEVLLKSLPSKQLESRIEEIAGQSSWKNRSKRKRPGYATIHFRQGEVVDTDEIARELVQADEDEVDGEMADCHSEEIREMATTLSTKKEISYKVKQQKAEKSKAQEKPDWFTRAYYKLSMDWRHFKHHVASMRYIFSLWQGHLNVIEGHFGSGVASYFQFIRGLFLLNVPVFLLTFAFVIVPQTLFRWFQQEPPGYHQNVSFTGAELLTGKGWFEQTELYYGYYTSDVINVAGAPYDMKFAYFCTCAGYYLLVLIILTRILSNSYKNSYVQMSDVFTISFASKVFCAWDFAILSQPTADLKRHKICTEIKELLSYVHKEETKKTPKQWAVVIATRVVINLVIIGIITGSCYLMYFLTMSEVLKNDLSVLSDLAMPICISALNFIVPFIFTLLIDFEDYESPRTKVYITMARTNFLNIVTLGVLVYSWFATGQSGQNECWETFMGAQIYSLVIVDFLFILIVTFLSEFLYRICKVNIGRWYMKGREVNQFQSSLQDVVGSKTDIERFKKPEFDVGRNTLNIVYSQILVWLGAYYSPLLSFIMILKLVFIFYMKRVSVMQNCSPPAKAWRAGQAATFIYGIVFLSFLLCISGFIYSIIGMKPSVTCGPYQNYTRTYEVFDVVVSQISSYEGLKFFVDFLTSAVFLAFVAIVLLVTAYYCRIVAKGHYEIAELLRQQINLEARDKVYLINLIKRETQKPERTSGNTPRPGNTGNGGRTDSIGISPQHVSTPSGITPIGFQVADSPPPQQQMTTPYVETPNPMYDPSSWNAGLLLEMPLPKMFRDYPTSTP